MGFPGGSVVENLPPVWRHRRRGFGLGSGKYTGGGNGSSLQHSCPENPVDRGGWQAPGHRVTKNLTCLNDWACVHTRHLNWCAQETYKCHDLPASFSPPAIFVFSFFLIVEGVQNFQTAWLSSVSWSLPWLSEEIFSSVFPLSHSPLNMSSPLSQPWAPQK